MLRRARLPLLLTLLAMSSLPKATAADAAPAPAPAPAQAAQAPAFRILPYLQQPSSSGMLLTWFSGQPEPGRVSLTGPGLDAPRTWLSQGEPRPEMAYTEREQAERIPGLEPGSWLWPGQAYRHRVALDGLQADTVYTLTVTQGSEAHVRRLRTAPTPQQWTRLRLVALSDSETEPRGRVTRREWAPGSGAEGRPSALPPGDSAWARRFGTTLLDGTPVLRYALTETEGFTENLKIIDSRQPDLVLMPGDLVQGSGYQPAWDEFFRHTAGPWGDLFTRVPLVAAMGNWETFAALNGGYGRPGDRSPAVLSRQRFKTFITGADNGTPAHRGNYHRTDFGPLTILTLDSTKGLPDDDLARRGPAPRLTGRAFDQPGTDTQASFTAEAYAQAARRLGLPDDLSPFNEGGLQWRWTQAQLADARAKGQIIFVQFHHAPFSDGEHGLPMDHSQSTGQGGTPMRVYHPLFERWGVVAVFSGHSEMAERSFVDSDGDGVGVHYFDVGVAGDGLRGERRTSPGFVEGPRHNRLQYNRHSCWSADEHEPERWVTQSDFRQLVDGGKHYGHLEVDVERVTDNPGAKARVVLRPVYSFPVLGDDYRWLRNERRVYSDVLQLMLDTAGRVRVPSLSQRVTPRCGPP